MKNKKGLTLIELVIVLALIGILSSLLFFPILFSFENFDKQSKTVNEISTARATMEILSKEIRKANSVSVNNSGVNDILILDDNSYYFKDDNITKGLVKKHLTEKEVFLLGGMQSIFFLKDSRTVTIKIIINKENSDDFELSSVIYLREVNNNE